MKVLPSEEESTRTQHRPTTQHERKGRGRGGEREGRGEGGEREGRGRGEGGEREGRGRGEGGEREGQEGRLGERGKGRRRGLVGEGDLLHTVTYHERLMAGFTRDNGNQKDKVPCKERMEKKGGTV